MATVDWLVVGNGVVGATTACLLADAGFSVTVLDGIARLPAHATPWDLRTFSLTPATRRILAACGAWSQLDPARIAPYHRMEVWESARGAQLSFAAGDIARTALGYIVEQSALIRALQAALQARPRVTVHAGNVAQLLTRDDSVEVHLQQGGVMRARAIAACDGAESPLRTLAGIELEEKDYPQRAVTANVKTTVAHGATARQVFLPEGPLAFLPLPESNSCSIIWSCAEDTASSLLEADDATFCQRLGAAFAHRLGQITATSRRLTFPLRWRHARRYHAGRVVLLGDAAHLMHPLAGQGLNVGLLDAAVLAEHAARAGMAGLVDPEPLFQRHARQRRGEVLAMLHATDGLNRLFLAGQALPRWLRSAGMRLTDRLSPVKQLLMAHAMGEVGDLPAIARPGAATLNASR